MKKILLIMLLLSIMLKANCQQASSIKLNIHLLFGSKTLAIADESYPLANGDSIRFDMLRFYISGIQLFYNNSLTYAEQNSFHLIDAADKNSVYLSFPMPEKTRLNKIKFNLGIDSLTNVSGVMGGDLDPTKGMYWTWQSGYINLKMEGRSAVCPARNHEFQFHLGGYQDPFYAMQTLELEVKNSGSLDIYFDLQKLTNELDLQKLNHIMSPGKEAVDLSELTSKCFSTR